MAELGIVPLNAAHWTDWRQSEVEKQTTTEKLNLTLCLSHYVIPNVRVRICRVGQLSSMVTGAALVCVSRTDSEEEVEHGVLSEQPHSEQS